MMRGKGQIALICDTCSEKYDDRPRHRDKDVVAEAVEAGWSEIVLPTLTAGGRHACPACAETNKGGDLMAACDTTWMTIIAQLALVNEPAAIDLARWCGFHKYQPDWCPTTFNTQK